MKIKCFYIFIMTCLLITFSTRCSSEQYVEEANPENMNNGTEIDPLILVRVFSKDAPISIEDIEEYAHSSSLTPMETMRSSKSKRNIKNIEVVKLSEFINLQNSGLKSIPDTLAYVINF